MVEVEMYSSVFSGSWEEFKILAINHTWYYKLWEICHRLNVEMKVDERYQIGTVRRGDQLTIDVAIEKGNRGKPLESINAVWK